MDEQEHWNKRYSGAVATEVSWYQERPSLSLGWIVERNLRDEAILDLGAGSSTLVDHLLESGHRDITLLDISAVALEGTRKRLKEKAKEIKWITSDVRTWKASEKYALIHDRAVFHFLTEAADRAAYKEVVLGAQHRGGTFILSTFAVDGPTKCSGLPIVQYSPESLSEELGPSFRLLAQAPEEHLTPGGTVQLFSCCLFERV